MNCLMQARLIFILAIIFLFPQSLNASDSQILINEITWMGTEVSSNDEWIELRNNTSGEMNLEGWTLNALDGSPSVNLIGTIPANGYFLLERTDDESVSSITADLIYTGSLSNGGETLEIRNDNGDLINSVVSVESWPAGDNTTKQTMEWSGSAWQTSTNPGGTPKVSNSSGAVVVVEEVESQDIASESSNTSSSSSNSSSAPSNAAQVNVAVEQIDLSYKDLIITEIYPNPPGSDSELEFIEFYNNGASSIDLSGFKVGDESARRYKIKNKILKPKKYWVLYRIESKIALNNDKDNVNVYYPGSEMAFLSVDYQKAEEGMSYVLDQNYKKKEYIWSQIKTPGKVNIIKEKNLAPAAYFLLPELASLGKPIIFDGTDSYDLNGDSLSYYWDFGDEFVSRVDLTSHAYFKAGEYKVMLEVSDGELKNRITKNLIISDINNVNKKNNIKEVEEDVVDNEIEVEYNIIISEIMPNPIGSDNEEWIELYNTSGRDVNLINWVIDDKEGGSKPHEFKENLTIKANNYLVLDKEDIKISLNNPFDHVRLFNQQNIEIDNVEYSKALEGEAYALYDGNWHWTIKDTPGQDNKLQVIENLSYKLLPELEEEAFLNKDTKVGDEYTEVALIGVKNLEIGSKVRTAGVVRVLPGVLGTQIFYIATEQDGVQIYNNKKDFPVMQVNDYVLVEGETSKANNELRIKTKIKTDIKVLESDFDLNVLRVDFGDFDESLVGQLIIITGVVTEKKGSVLYLDDGESEIEVYVKSGSGIKMRDIVEGSNYEVRGVVSMTNVGPKLMPRNIDDFVLLDNEKVKNDYAGFVQETDNWSIPARNKKQELFNYLLIIVGATSIFLFGYLFVLGRRN